MESGLDDALPHPVATEGHFCGEGDNEGDLAGVATLACPQESPAAFGRNSRETSSIGSTEQRHFRFAGISVFSAAGGYSIRMHRLAMRMRQTGWVCILLTIRARKHYGARSADVSVTSASASRIVTLNRSLKATFCYYEL